MYTLNEDEKIYTDEQKDEIRKRFKDELNLND